VEADERWLVLGANGSGKTTLVRIAAMYEHPSSGDVTVLGERLGRTDVLHLHPHTYRDMHRCSLGQSASPHREGPR
jgi:ABC-type molybdenum transport system ATPase subunit/photorepair protein PhrA